MGVFFLVPTGRGTGLKALTPLEREDAMHWLHDVSNRVAIKTTEGPQYRRIVIEAQRGIEYEGGELYKYLTEETERVLGPADVSHTRRPARRWPSMLAPGSSSLIIWATSTRTASCPCIAATSRSKPCRISMPIRRCLETARSCAVVGQVRGV